MNFNTQINFAIYYATLMMLVNIIVLAATTTTTPKPYDPNVRYYSSFNGKYQVGYINFEFPFKNFALDVSPIHLVVTRNLSACAAECVMQTASPKKCVSLNIERISSDTYNCWLFDTDKYREYNKFIPKSNTDHYTIKSQCSEYPCQAAGTMCIPHYGNRSFECPCNYEHVLFEGKCIPKLPKDGVAEQIGIFGNNHAQRAVDGDYNQNLNEGGCSTSGNVQNAWWKFTFNFEVEIQMVDVYGREDYPYASRINHALIEVYDKDELHFQRCGDIGVIGADSMKRVVCTNKSKGRGVKITLAIRNYLSICEIDFYGEKL